VRPISSIMETPTLVRKLAGKLAHEVLEIRERALDSLLFKLQHGILSLADIVHDYELIRSLFEWFNFAEVHRHDDVLSLLVRISEDPLAARMIWEMDGVKFMRHMKDSLSAERFTQPILTIEKILTSLEDPKHIEVWKKMNEIQTLTSSPSIHRKPEDRTLQEGSLRTSLKPIVQKGKLQTLFVFRLRSSVNLSWYFLRIVTSISNSLRCDLFVHGCKLSPREEDLVRSLLNALNVNDSGDIHNTKRLMEECACFLEGSGFVQIDILSVGDHIKIDHLIGFSLNSLALGLVRRTFCVGGGSKTLLYRSDTHSIYEHAKIS
jgi:hypothetical protein